MAIAAVLAFLEGRRVLYAAPTAEQINRFWTEVTRALADPIVKKAFRKNETEHFIEVPGTERRIKAKTAWNAATLRGDYADLLILDEFQMMHESVWNEVGAPMLLDNNGDAVFIYTPPSLTNTTASKADDPQHAAKLYKRAKADTRGRWQAFHFTSMDNPHLDRFALDEISEDMSDIAYRMEILAEDLEEAPGALWKRDTIERSRVERAPEELYRIVVAVDPSTTARGAEAGIITAGSSKTDMWVLADDSLQGSPQTWAQAAINAYRRWEADLIVAEKNQGGEMVELTLHTIDPTVPVRLVSASRGKAPRAQPVSALYEKMRCHHVGAFYRLEDELCLWMPGDDSPNRLDALVWAATELMLAGGGPVEYMDNPFYT